MDANREIPAWIVGAIGALTVALATTIGGFRSVDIDRDVRDVEATKHQIEVKRQTAYMRHTQTYDMTFPMAELFWGLHGSIGDVESRAYFRRLASKRAGDAVNVMMQISGPSFGGYRSFEYGRKLMEQVRALQTTLLNDEGSEDALEKLEQLFNENMMASRQVLDHLDNSIEAKSKELDVLRSRQDANRNVQAGVTLIGLVVLLLRDVPIWRLRRKSKV